MLNATVDVRPHARAGVEIVSSLVSSVVTVVRPHARAGVEITSAWMMSAITAAFALMRGRELK